MTKTHIFNYTSTTLNTTNNFRTNYNKTLKDVVKKDHFPNRTRHLKLIDIEPINIELIPGYMTNDIEKH